MRPRAGRHRAWYLLAVHGVTVSTTMSILLGLAPRRVISGTANRVLYQELSPRCWAMLWAAVAVVSFVALGRPRLAEVVLPVLAGVYTLWGVLLAWPLLEGYATVNLLAPVPWFGGAAAIWLVARVHSRRDAD